MDTFLNILVLFFALSGFVAWMFVIFIGLFFWACNRPPQEE